MFSKKNILIILLTIISLQNYAQKPSNEFIIFGGVGMPVFMSSGTSVSGFTGDAGIGYTTFFSQQIGFHLGMGFGFINLDARIDNKETVTFGMIDENSLLFDKYTTLSDYKETKKATFLSIPAMLQFQQTPTRIRPHVFYAMGGAKFVFQQQTDYNASVATLSNAAYYPEFDNWAATQEFANLGIFDGNNNDGKFNPELFVNLAFEAGMKWRISNNTILYTGAFLDYALNDPARNYRQPYGEFITPDHLTNLTLLTHANKINLTTVGIKLRLSFSRSSTPSRQTSSRNRQQRMVPCWN
jgi:hypothetical protein